MKSSKLRWLTALALLGCLGTVAPRAILGQPPAAAKPASQELTPVARDVFVPTAPTPGVAPQRFAVFLGDARPGIESLLQKYTAARDEKDKAKIKEAISAELAKQFESQQARQQKEIERLEAQVQKLRDLVKKRQEARQTIVEKRLEQLLRDAEGLGWTPSPPSGDAANHYYRDLPPGEANHAAPPAPVPVPLGVPRPH